MAVMSLATSSPFQELWMSVVERVGRWAWIMAAAAMMLVHKRSKKITVGLSRSSDGKLSVELNAPACCKVRERLDGDPFAAGRDFDLPAKKSPSRSLLETLGEGNFVCKGVGIGEEARDSQGEEEHTAEEEEEAADLGVSWKFSVPEWANSLLQPLMPRQEWGDYRQVAKDFNVYDPRPRMVVAKGPKYLARAKDEVVKLWGSSKQKILESWNLPAGQGFVTALGLGDHDLQRVIEAVAAGTSHGFLNLWDVTTGECVRSFQGSPGFSIEAVAMGLNGSDAGIYSSSAGLIGMWDDRAMKKAVERFQCFDKIDSLAASTGGIEWSCGRHEFIVRQQGCVEDEAFDVRMAARSCRGLALPKEAAAGTAMAEEEEEQWWDAMEEQGEWVEEEEEEESDGDEEIEAHVSSSSGNDKGFFSRCVSLLHPCTNHHHADY